MGAHEGEIVVVVAVAVAVVDVDVDVLKSGGGETRDAGSGGQVGQDG